MNRKVMAVAVAGALAAPAAFAQTSNVQLYGRVNIGLDNYSARDASAGDQADFKARTRVFDMGSRIGLRGTEDLGAGGLKAIFQIESGANVDSGTYNAQSGAQNNSTGLLASRDSFAGLDSNFGRLIFGKMNVWWTNGPMFQVGANYANTDTPHLSGNTGRVNMGVTRASNVAQYTSPTFGGVNLQFAWSPDSGGSGGTVASQCGVATGTAGTQTSGFNNSECAQGGRNVNGSIVSARASWAGPAGINLIVDWTQKKAPSDASNRAANGADAGRLKNTGMKVVAGWAYMPGAMAAIQLQQVKNDNVAAITGFTALGDDVKASTWALHWEHTFGNMMPYVEVGQVLKAKGCTEAFPAGGTLGVSGTTCDGTDATSYGLGLRYLLSKRTSVYVTYNQTINKDNATSDYAGGGQSSSAGALPAGADPRIVALGMMHNF
jgi:predicted porin